MPMMPPRPPMPNPGQQAAMRAAQQARQAMTNAAGAGAYMQSRSGRTTEATPSTRRSIPTGCFIVSILLIVGMFVFVFLR